MTKDLAAALGAHYHRAVIAADPTKAARDLAATLRADPKLAEQARDQLAILTKVMKYTGNIDKMKQRDFAGATHLQGLTEALAQL